eukprot:9466968-Pyramimonas_sp.AAC.2
MVYALCSRWSSVPSSLAAGLGSTNWGPSGAPVWHLGWPPCGAPVEEAGPNSNAKSNALDFSARRTYVCPASQDWARSCQSHACHWLLRLAASPDRAVTI